jgi:mono/diheme cytochrome c family protein
MRKQLRLVAGAGVVALAAVPLAWSQGAHEDGAPVIGGVPTPGPVLAQAGGAQDPALAELLATGKARYEANCASCHGIELGGGEGPKLAGNAHVGDNAILLSQMILGGGYMPAFGRLSNATLAAIASYVRNTHDNDYGIVTAEEVAAAR